MTTAPHDVMSAAQRLHARHLPYALVSVLRVQAPASARPGDKAVITADGVIDGWIGGGCAQPAVLRTVRQALLDGRARLIRISPSEGDAAPAPAELDDILEFGMRCHSGGTLELFVDPMLPPARLTVFGDSPVAVALAALAPRVGFELSVIAPGADAQRFPDAAEVLASDEIAQVGARIAPGSFVVVATQGRRDLPGLQAALALQARCVWFVASARKAQVLRESLLAMGEDAAAVQAIVAPAGQAIGAQTPEEIALSVLAAVVAARRGKADAAMEEGAGGDAGPADAASGPAAADIVSGAGKEAAGAAGPAGDDAGPGIPEAAARMARPSTASCCGG